MKKFILKILPIIIIIQPNDIICIISAAYGSNITYNLVGLIDDIYILSESQIKNQRYLLIMIF